MTIPHVRAIDDLGPTPTQGVTRSRYFRCDDGDIYIVKFFDGMKTLINELVGCSLALAINLPTPQIAFIEVKADLIDIIPELSNVSPGSHLGSKKLKNVTDFHNISDETLSKCLENPLDLYGVISFDNWLLNGDRRNKGNNMIESIAADKIRYHMVDFSHCFGGNDWEVEKLNNLKNFNSLVKIFSFILRFIDDLTKFEKSLLAIENLDDLVIDKFINLILPAWNLRTSEKNLMLDVIKHRKTMVRNIIHVNKVGLGL